MSASRSGAAKAVLLLFGLTLGALLAIKLANVLLLAFAAILVAILLDAIALPLVRRGIDRRVAIGLALLAFVALVALAAALLARPIAAQFSSLWASLPSLSALLTTELAALPFGEHLLAAGQGTADLWWTQSAQWAGQSLAAAAAALIVVFAGVYLAARPRVYVDGALRLIPARQVARIRPMLGHCHSALQQWLLSQALSMAAVGVITSLALWLIGAPAPLALGLLAGAAQMVPVIGPLAAAVVGVVFCAGSGLDKLLWTGGVYVAVSQLESNLLSPFILANTAHLPMAVTLFAVLAMGFLLGPLGVLLATPLAVLAYTLTRELTQTDTETPPPGPNRFAV